MQDAPVKISEEVVPVGDTYVQERRSMQAALRRHVSAFGGAKTAREAFPTHTKRGGPQS